MSRPDAIAVVGYAGRFPGATDAEQFWSNLRDGVDVRVEFSDADLDRAGVPAAVRADPEFVRAGYVLDGVGDFDAELFGMSPAEAALVDPQQRLFLECVWTAFEHAGHRPGGAVGVFAGSGFSGYLLDVLRAHRRTDLRGPGDLVASYQALTANDKDFLASRVSYKLDLTGPSVVVQTACSTSLVAVHLAVQSLLTGECDLAVAGAVSVLLPQRAGYLPQTGMILSPDGRCRPFDANAAGTVRGDGVGAVLLRPLADALADGDTVHGVILGTAVNNDGAGKLGFSATSVQRQRDVVVQAHEMAEVDVDSIDYVEAHGTGTDLGDPAEVLALAQAFGRGAGGRCVLGSVKGDVGHLDSAAGIAGLIKVLLMFRHGRIPAVLHHRRLNPKIELGTRFEVNAEPRDWPGVDGVRRAGITSLGIGGTNVHVVLEQPPAPEPARPAEGSQLLLLSARTPVALAGAGRSLAAALAADDAPALADAAWTTQVGRVRWPHRRFVRVGPAAAAPAGLRSGTGTHDTAEHRPVALLLPGQGAQRVGMGLVLAAREPVFRDTVNEVAGLFAERGGEDVRAALYAAPGPSADERLAGTALTQAAMFTTEYALAALLASWGVRPVALLGHSVGELVAATLAGVFPLAGAVQLVAERGSLMAALPGGAMLSVALAEAAAAELAVEHGLDLAAVNGPLDCVLSGPSIAVAAAADRLRRSGVDCRPLRTSHAFHSAMMDPVVAPFTEVVRAVGPRPPTVPLVSTVTGELMSAEQATDPAYWGRQLRAPVRFAAALDTLLSVPGPALVEVGPGRALAALARRSPARSGTPVIGTMDGGPDPAADEHDALLDAVGQLWVAGVDVDWVALHGGRRRRRVPLPGYSFDRRRHWAAAPPEDSPTAGAGAAPTIGPRPVRDWLYEPSWLRASTVSRATAMPRRWLVLDGGDPLATAVAERLAEAGHTVARAARPTSARLADVDAVLQAGGGPAELLEVAQVLHDGRAGAELWVLGRQLCRVESGDRVDPRRAALLGLAAVLPWELGGGCRVLDVTAATSPEQVLAALTEADPAPVSCLRGPFRWTAGVRRVDLPTSEGFRTGGTYVVTGGLGVVGRHITDRLLNRLDARVVVLGRSAEPRDADRFAVLRTDVADVDGLRTAFATAVERFGPVDGVVHAAGLAGVAALATVPGTTRATLADHFRAKVDGTAALATVLDGLADPPRFCLLMSSTAAMLGGAGLGAYAAANAALDAVATARVGTGPTRWTSVGWDGWLGSDDELPPTAGAGRHALRPVEALDLLDRAAAWPSGGRLTVSRGDLATRMAEPPDGVAADPARSAPTADGGDPDRIVAEVWRQVLGLDDIDPDANFFDLGGDSMTGLRVIRKVSDLAGVELSPVDVFEAPTVRSLAALLATRLAGPTSAPDGPPDPAEGAAASPAGSTVEEQRAQLRRAALRRASGGPRR